MKETELSLAGNYSIPDRESFISDILAGDGKNDNLFYSVILSYISFAKWPPYL